MSIAHPPIILASASPRRKELLALICPEYKVIPSEFDESLVPADLLPGEHVAYSAAEKARDVANNNPGNCIIIGSDTVVSIDEHILGKPAGEDDANRMLRLLSGRTHQVYTGIYVISQINGKRCEHGEFVCTDVKFRELNDEIITRYVSTGEPMDKAGAYAIQGYGSVLVEGISGCFFNVVGLPVQRLSAVLEEFGVEVLSCR